MAEQLADLVSRDAHIVVPNTAVSASRANDMLIPRETRDLRGMARHSTQLRLRLRVP